MVTHGRLFEGLDTEEAKKEKLDGEHRGELLQWKRAFVQPATTARNRLLQLFNEVSDLFVRHVQVNLKHRSTDRWSYSIRFGTSPA